MLIDLDELETLSASTKLFSFNKWNITSILNKDHGARDGSDIKAWVLKHAQKRGLDFSDGKIFLLSFPRMWGYVFNPLTVYYCYSPEGELKAILYEVKNTFGEQHSYLIEVNPEDNQNIKQETDKIFYVSPFIEMACRYKFRITPPSEDFSVAIHQYMKDGKILTATWEGTYLPFTTTNLRHCILKHPLMTFKVIAGIHKEAFHLWRKGAKYYSRPSKPLEDVT